MPRVDPPYPSFAFVLSSTLEPRNARSSRLPAYRASHMGRFHPYPRVAPGRCTDRLMNTVDYRYAEDPLWEEAGAEPGDATENEENLVDAEVVPATTHCEPSDDENTTTPATTESRLSRSKLVMTLSDTLAALRRYLSRQAMKTFFASERSKGA
ncbi:hypothetical protein OH77DRAFT_1515442 [Trametes cingulata]|nr:hypothetical protein OH77DRAFT_1515442 [Trametes cingulata]